MSINLSIKELCDIIEGTLIKNNNNTAKILEIGIYADYLNCNSAYFALDSTKYSNSDGGLGFTCNEDSVYGLGGTQDGNDYIHTALLNGVTTIISDKKDKCEIYDGINIIIVNDVLESLATMAKYLLKFYDNKVIAVTGSTGKTTATDSIYKFINSKLRVSKSHRIRTTYLGLIIDIIENAHVADWFIIEMQSDAKGQISKFCSVAEPDIAVITTVNNSHLSRYESPINILEEKLSVYYSLKDNGYLIINTDDEVLKKWYESHSNNRIITIGTSSNSNYFANKITTYGEYKFCEFNVISNITDFSIEVKLNLPGNHHIYSTLISIAISQMLKFSKEDIQKCFVLINSIVGRFQGFKGQHDSLVIIDSYNGNLLSTCSGINYISNLGTRNNILIIGSLLELANETETDHRKLARYICRYNNIAHVILIGENTLYVKSELLKFHFDESKIFHTFTYEDVIDYISKLKIDSNTSIYIKGSGAMRMELIGMNLLSNIIF